MVKPKDTTVFWTHSDDCAGIRGRYNIDESALWGKWWPLLIDGELVGDVMVDYGDGWEFHLQPAKDHKIEVVDDPRLLPPDEDEAWWTSEDEDA